MIEIGRSGKFETEARRAGLLESDDLPHLPRLRRISPPASGCEDALCEHKGAARDDEATYQDGDFLIFGCETRGLPENLLEQVYDRCIRIPMRPEARSLNLSNSVAIVLYEALRQTDFPGLSSQGHLTGRDEEPAPWLGCD